MRQEPPKSLNRITQHVIGAAIEVHRHLGPGFLESVYEEAIAIELRLRGLPLQRQVSIPVLYKGEPVGEGRLDLLVEDTLVVELKAVEEIVPIHIAQVVSYLRATGSPLGLLINFNVRLLRHGIQRVVFDPARYASALLVPTEPH